MSNHFLKMVLDDGFQGPHVEFECKADRFAVCRRRPLDESKAEEWTSEDELDGGGHVCWIAEWIEAVDMSECFPAEAGVPVRFRKFVVDDTFATGEENCTAALTVGQYATVGTAGKWVPAAEAPSTAGCYAKVISKYIVSQGVDGKLTDNGVQAYMLCIMAN